MNVWLWIGGLFGLATIGLCLSLEWAYQDARRRFRRWRADAGRGAKQFLARDWERTICHLYWLAGLPERFWRGLTGAPSELAGWFAALPWEHWLTVRRGFLFGALAGLWVAGSILWAIPTVLPLIPGRPAAPAPITAEILPITRPAVPQEMAWFFIQFPYVSESAKIRVKNRHTYIVEDAPRRREYVVSVGQRYRRVEIYTAGSGETQVHVLTPGSKRIVRFQNNRIIGQATAPDGNLWMWNGPLWNATHVKIYGLADLWLNSPYKRYSCAGFVHKFLRDAGIQVPILDAWDMAKLPWMRIPMEELEPGDIITFEAASREHRRFWGHRITHVGVYVGHGKFIHAATPSRKARRSFVRLADVKDFQRRVDKVIRPPDLL